MPNSNTAEAAKRNSNFWCIALWSLRWRISKPVSELNWWTSLVPAPAVFPAPIAYMNAAAVKKLVVGYRAQVALWPVWKQNSVTLLRRNVG